MRIVHVADTHLGYRNFSGKLDPTRNLNQRECDVYDAWHAAIDLTIELEPDVFVHAGDLFDSSRPSPIAVIEALQGFEKLRDAGIPAVVIAGNHSTPRFRSGGSVFGILEHVGITAVWDEPQVVRVNGLAIHCVPHEPSAEQLLADIRGLPLDAKVDGNVLVVHAGLEGVRQGYHEVNETSLDPEELSGIEYDYVALGHLHRYQVPQLNAAYAGSLERLDFGDLAGEKGVVEVDLSAGAGSATFLRQHPVPTRPMIDLEIPCEGLAATDVLRLLEQRAATSQLDGAVVRIRLEGIDRNVYHALELAAVDELFEPCLHVVRSVGSGGLVVATESDDPELDFKAFARDAIPADLDPEPIIRLALGYLEDAAAAEAEEAAT